MTTPILLSGNYYSGAGPHATAVPAGTMLAVVSWGWFSATGDDCISMTLGGIALTKRAGYAAISLQWPTAGVLELIDPPIGDQTLECSWTQNASSARFHLGFYSGTRGIRDAATGKMAWDFGTPATILTDAFDVMAGDLCQAEGWAYTNGVYTNGGQSIVDLNNPSGPSLGLVQKIAVSNGTDTMQVYGTYLGLVGWSFVPADMQNSRNAKHVTRGRR